MPTATPDTTEPKREKLPVLVEKPIPLEFDMGNLCAFDTNPLDPETYKTNREECLAQAARDGAQALINQVLTVITLKSTLDGVFAELPAPVTPLPREKPLPKPREPTAWERFAKKKGIAPKARDGKLVYDEEKGDWVPKWGYKGKNKDGEGDWLVEVDDKKQKMQSGGDEEKNPRSLSRDERKERIKKNERQQKKNEKKSQAGGVGSGRVFKPRPGAGGPKRRR